MWVQCEGHPKLPRLPQWQGGPGKMTPACSLLTECEVESTDSWGGEQGNCGPSARGESAASHWDQLSIQCYRCQRWGHMASECPTPSSVLNQPRGNWGNVAHPHQQQLPKAAIGPSHSLLNPRPRLASFKMAQQTGPWEATLAVPFLNPDLIACLVQWSYEEPIIVDGQKVTTLIDLGAQVFSVSSGFFKQMTLKVQPLDRLLELDSTGNSAIPSLGYVEVNLQIPGIRGYSEDFLLLVIPTINYSEKVPVIVGSQDYW